MLTQRWRRLGALFIVVGLYVVVYGYNLGFPKRPYFDEVYHVRTAQLIVRHEGYKENTHPPLGKFLVASSIRLLGNEPAVWRLVSFLAGLGCILTLFALVRTLSGSLRIAFFTAFLFSFDSLCFTQARITMLNAQMLFFALLSFWCAAQGSHGSWSRSKSNLLAGIIFGLAVGTRWACATSVALLVLLCLTPNEKRGETTAPWNKLWIFLVASIVTYFSTFLLVLTLKTYNQWIWIFKFQWTMAHYHILLKSTHRYDSDWWSWPLLLRPIWYYFTSTGKGSLKLIQGIICLGNPAIYWALGLGLAYSFYDWWKRRTYIAGFAIIGIFAHWLPFAFMSRVQFHHYFYAVVPFGALTLALGLDQIWKKGRIGRDIVVVYLIGVLVMFVYWYPLLTGISIPHSFYKHHLWLKTWT